MQRYNPKKIESKWQKKWYASAVFKAKNSGKNKFYLLDEFPYPSGDGLHVGHCRPYIGLDVIARKKRMQGQNVLFPMGWDAFGLPAENYAIKKGIHPSITTKKAIATFKKQMQLLGLSFDWSREINTTDPRYYKWTQWIFTKLFKKGLAYKDTMSINWCPKDKTGLANEEVIGGKCERCGTQVEKRQKEQWLIKITKYADRLIKDLDLVEYPERVKIQQKEWIGRSEGVHIHFPIENSKKEITVFTTRPDTIFGATFLVIAPEHPIIEESRIQVTNYKEVQDYVGAAKNKSDLQRQEAKEKTGIEVKGLKGINPANKKEIPIFVADYVMVHYGTGAIMGVPADDERDREFAVKFNLPIIREYQKAKMEDFGKKIVNYKLRDWVFSRQHYWGEPIPMIFCKKCGWVAVPDKDLPVELPRVKKYQPTDTGESPLSSIEKWVNVACPECSGAARRETDTMPNWAGSNWYYLAYPLADKLNLKFKIKNLKFQDIFTKNKNILAYWMPVDWYNGGMEHTTLHLLYSRFIFKFLWDIGAIPKEIGSEPYKKRTSHGVILGPGGVKMSKSRGNVINPDDVVKQYGADTLRVYEMFIGPFEQMIPWDEKGIIGCRRFLEKVYVLAHTKVSKTSDSNLKNSLNKTIKKVSEDIEAMKFNTAISSMMTFVNEWSRLSEDNRGSSIKSGHGSGVGLNKKEIQQFLIILSPFAPHLTEELWQMLQFKGLCGQQSWPSIEQIKEEKIVFIIQINGKVRDKMEIDATLNQNQIEDLVLHAPKIKPWLQDKPVKKIIFVPGKLINIVI